MQELRVFNRTWILSHCLYLETNMNGLLITTSAATNDEIICQSAYSLYLLASMCGALALE